MNHTLIEWIAGVGAVGAAGMVILQLLLATGVAPGSVAFGGNERVLPTKLRAASAVSALVFGVAFYLIIARGDLIGRANYSSAFVRDGIWVVVAILSLSTVANVASRSPVERRVMAPLALVLAACFLIVALG